MLLAPLKQLLQQISIKGVDSEKIWAMLSEAKCYVLDDLKDIEPFSVMGLSSTPSQAQLLVAEVSGATMFAALLPVDGCGLATLLHSQLSYVPKYAILEWYFLSDNGGFRDLVTCIGHHSLTETYGESVLGFASLTGAALPTDVVQTIAENKEVLKPWCFATLQALDKRHMLLHSHIEPNRTKVSLASCGYTHAIH